MSARSKKPTENEVLIKMIGDADQNAVDIKKLHEEAELNFIKTKLLSGEYTLIRKTEANKINKSEVIK